jgi:hypothetical protein
MFRKSMSPVENTFLTLATVRKPTGHFDSFYLKITKNPKILPKTLKKITNLVMKRTCFALPNYIIFSQIPLLITKWNFLSNGGCDAYLEISFTSLTHNKCSDWYVDHDCMKNTIKQ